MCSLRQEADQAHAEFASARGRLVSAVAALRESDGWRGDGAANLESWICARWQMSQRSARDLVRDAEALAARPALAAALSAGEISLDQCKAIATLSDEGTDDAEAWLEVLSFWTISDLEREARRKKARELERRDDGQYLRASHTPDERYVRGDFQLHPENWAVVLAALDARVPDGTPLRDWDHATALALVELAKGAEAPRPTMLVSVLADGIAQLPSGDFVGTDTTERLLCDSKTQPLYTNADGNVLAIGRTTSTVSPNKRRAVFARDGGRCTFPECERDHFLDVHHIIRRADGGPDELWNLTLVCWTHHVLVHEHGWRVRGPAGPDMKWLRPDGSVFEPRVRVTLDTS
jgi:hypothetical protein